MEKIIIQETIDSDINWNQLTEISTVKANISLLEDLGVTHLEICHYYEDHNINPTIFVHFLRKREETDDELEKRIERKKYDDECLIKNELKQLAYLKNKYENK